VAAKGIAGSSSTSTRPWIRRLAAETFGTFALVFVAAGADTMARVSGGSIEPTARAAAPALMVGALIYAISDASGAHFNPIVSLAFTLKGLFPPLWLPPYWIAQVTGAVVAAVLLRGLFGDAMAASVSEPRIAPATALVIEAVLTWLLVTVILGTADRARIVGPDAALAVAATIALCGFIALPLEGASMNPARSFGPAVVAGRLGDLWIYVLGPTIGAALAVLGTTLIHGPSGTRRAREAAQGVAADAVRGGRYPGRTHPAVPTPRPGFRKRAGVTSREDFSHRG
jgi:aquaporin Z